MKFPGFTAQATLDGGMDGYTSGGFATGAVASPSDSVTPQGWLIYGNYCGPRAPGEKQSYSKPPIDAVDGACMAHDRCYDSLGYGKCR